jgi:hypothetical protein
VLKRFAIPASSLLCAAMSAVGASQPADINGFHVGMQQEEFSARYLGFCYTQQTCERTHKAQFNYGGVTGAFLTATYDSTGGLDSAEFAFEAGGFDALKRTLLERYPDARCADTGGIDFQGQHVPQVICRRETATDGIYLLRVSGSVNRSLLFVASAAKRGDVAERLAAAATSL